MGTLGDPECDGRSHWIAASAGGAALDGADGLDVEMTVKRYLENNAQQVARILRVMRSFETASHDDLAPMMVAIRQVRTLLA